jgi:hypothetical protein
MENVTSLQLEANMIVAAADKRLQCQLQIKTSISYIYNIVTGSLLQLFR